MNPLRPTVTIIPIDSKHSGHSCNGCDFASANPFSIDQHVLDTGHAVTYTITEVREVRRVEP